MRDSTAQLNLLSCSPESFNIYIFVPGMVSGMDSYMCAFVIFKSRGFSFRMAILSA